MSGVLATTGKAYEPCTVMLYRKIGADALITRVRGEYREMPGMRLTIDQAMRLWNLDRQTCSKALGSLVASHYLELDASGRYRKAHSGY